MLGKPRGRTDITKIMLNKLKLPIFIAFIAFTLVLFWNVFKLPKEEALIEIIKSYFDRYGLVTVYIAAIIEGALFVGWYLPGSMVIFLGIILANGDVKKSCLSVIFTILGLITAYIINYCVGKYGWSKLFKILKVESAIENAKIKYKDNDMKAIYLSYWQPNLAGLVSTAAGTLHAKFLRFFIHSCIATILWCSFWGVITFTFGKAILNYMGTTFMVVLVCWILYILLTNKKAKQYKSE